MDERSGGDVTVKYPLGWSARPTVHRDLAIGIVKDTSEVVEGGVVDTLYGSADGLSMERGELWHQDVDGVPGVAEPGDDSGSAFP